MFLKMATLIHVEPTCVFALKSRLASVLSQRALKMTIEMMILTQCPPCLFEQHMTPDL